MKWIKIALETTTEAVDLVSDLLNELGIDGIEIEDNLGISEEDRKKMFIDILPELPPDEGKATVTFYLDEDEDIDAKLAEVMAGLEELDTFVNTGAKSFTVSETEDADWINNWKAFFKPFRVDDTIVIKPTWETLEETKEDDMVIEIDPGTAFGTGSHETTKLCILNLKKYVKEGDKVLDLGCGSGILSIASILLGAEEVTAVDIDQNSVKIAKENAEKNNIAAEKYTAYCGNVIDDNELVEKIGGGYDVVAANIVADAIIMLSGKLFASIWAVKCFSK